MVRAILSLIFAFILLFQAVSPVMAQVDPDPLRDGGTEWFPWPGNNCGVAGDPLKNSCCIAAYENFGEIDTSGTDGIPIIGGVIDQVAGALSYIVDTFPYVLIPEQITFWSPIPSVGRAKSAAEKIPLCTVGNPHYSQDSIGNNVCTCSGNDETSVDRLRKMCLNIKSEREKLDCFNCISGSLTTGTSQNQPQNSGATQGVWTSIGCVSTASPKEFIEKTLFGFGLGLAGVAALFCIIFAAFQLQTSRGNPERIKKSQELLTSCIMGLMLIIFSIFILRLIGVTILRLPGLQ